MVGETPIFSCNDLESSNWSNQAVPVLGMIKPHQSQGNWIDWLRSPDKVFQRCTRKDLFFWTFLNRLKTVSLLYICNILQLNQYWTRSNACLDFFKGVAHHGNTLFQHDVILNLSLFFQFGSSECFQHSKCLFPKVVNIFSKGNCQTCKNCGVWFSLNFMPKKACNLKSM